MLFEAENEWAPCGSRAARKLTAERRIKEDPPALSLGLGGEGPEADNSLSVLGHRGCTEDARVLMVVVCTARTPGSTQTGKPLVYIDFLETAPWNAEGVHELSASTRDRHAADADGRSVKYRRGVSRTGSGCTPFLSRGILRQPDAGCTGLTGAQVRT